MATTSHGDAVALAESSITPVSPAVSVDEEQQEVVMGGDTEDSLTCDNNNNDLTFAKTASHPEDTQGVVEVTAAVAEDLSAHFSGGLSLTAPIMHSISKEHIPGDQSIDSGLAGGDSDEADFGAVGTPPLITQSLPCIGGGAVHSSSSSLIGSGDDFKAGESRDSPFGMSPAEKMLQDQFFLGGIAASNYAVDNDDDDDDKEEDEKHSDLGGSLEEDNHPSRRPTKGGLLADCKLCQNQLQSPRVLSCLHVFCERCLDNLLRGGGVEDMGCITCPVCQQWTPVGIGGSAALLHQDYVLTNILDLSSVDASALACTSCKSKDVAISRCNDCANILCASCDNAHQYMRCFEKHTVVRLTDLLAKASDTVAIHKPLFCRVHPTENLKYFCLHCQVPVCNECLIGEHKGSEHCYELIADAEMEGRLELERLLTISQDRVDKCNEAQLELNAALMDLQAQHDSARSAIEESYQSFKAVLERCRDDALKDLDSLHSERELKVMEVMHEVEKSTEKIECAGRFAERMLGACNAPELLSLKGVVANQFVHLVKNIPRTHVDFSLEFVPHFEQFQRMARSTFGKFQTEASSSSLSACAKEKTPPPTLSGLPPPPPLPLGLRSAGGQPPSTPASVLGISAFNGTSATQSGVLSNSGTLSQHSPVSMHHTFESESHSGLVGNSTPVPSSALLDHHHNHNHHQHQHHSSQVGNGVGVANAQCAPNVPNVQQMPSMSVPPPNIVGAGGLTSIAEYNIQQLANLVEQSSSSSSSAVGVIPAGADMTDSILSTTNVNVPPPSAQGPITLNDILSIDPQALQAWSKMGGLNQPNALLSRGPSPGVDNLLLNDFSAIVPNSDDLMLANFNAAAAASGSSGSVSGAGGGGGGIGGGSQQSSLGQGIGVPGRTKSTAMQIRSKFGALGPSKGQFNSPHGFCLGMDEDIVVADTNNHRIEVFDKAGTFKFQFGVPGKDEGQLWYPRKVAVMRTSSKFVVCDRGNERSRMQIFNKAGHFMKKIAIRYIDIVAGLAVTNLGHIVAVDSVSPTVFIISEEGELVHWFDCSDYMREPSDIAINGNDFYVCDFKGHCVAVFNDDGTFKYRIGNEKITCFPNGIDISDAGDILIGDSHGNRFHVACFSRDGVLQSEYECPYVKVSRCCGLKITSEGYVVTLAKNNHHVLVLNTLYIQ